MPTAHRTADTDVGNESRKPSPSDLCSRPPYAATWARTVVSCKPRISSAALSPTERRELIDSILTSTRELAEQLSGLVADNRETLTPALQQLSRVTDILSRNRAALARTVDELAPFVRVFTNTLGNGRWFDSFVNDLIPTVVGAAVCSGADTPATGCRPAGQ